MNAVRVNSGIGDMLLSRAMLYGSRGRIAVALGEESAMQSRNAEYLPFARELFAVLFRGFSVAPADAPRLDPQAISRLTGMSPRWPWVSDLGGARSAPSYVVTTKVRGLPRRIYESFREDFVDRVRRLAMRSRVLIVGEKEIGMNAEYRHHGEDHVYSIYGDLIGIGCEDQTVDELGLTPPTMGQFVRDMATMQGATSTITLGTGGNTTMAMAAGNCHSFVGFGEMESFFAAMPWRPQRCRMFDSADYFLGGIGSVA